jgi:hypothetical protein
MADIKEYEFDEVAKNLAVMINNRETFVLRGLAGRMIEVTGEVEREVEKQDMSCRIYSRNRAAAATATAFVPALGLIPLTAVAVHNISTWNPDYEIGKDIIDNKLHITFKK